MGGMQIPPRLAFCVISSRVGHKISIMSFNSPFFSLPRFSPYSGICVFISLFAIILIYLILFIFISSLRPYIELFVVGHLRRPWPGVWKIRVVVCLLAYHK